MVKTVKMGTADVIGAWRVSVIVPCGEEMRALTILKPDQVQIKQVRVPDPSKSEVLVKVMASGICGTDIHIFRGDYLGDYPVIPGHEFSGVVEKTGNEVTRFRAGDRVAVEPNISCDNCFNCLNKRQNFCLNWQAVGVTKPGGMAQFVLAPEKNVFSIGNVPFEQAAFMEPLSCVLHGLERADINIADRVVIFGAGPIGLLMVKMMRILGTAELWVVEKIMSRAEHAKQCGATRIYHDTGEIPGDYFDVVIDATGVLQLMSRELEYVRHGGTVLFFGVPPMGKMMDIEAFTLFRKGLKILSSFTSLRNSYQAVKLFLSGKIRVDDIISHRLPLTDFQRGIELIEKGVENVKKVIILPNG
jgi:2-desacetyl-2-hydroxyethyl bacteriochlorophyllide A dehydrogenase